MNARLDVLERERELLVARSALCRLRMRSRTRMLRDSFSWGGAAIATATTLPARRLAFDLAVSFVGMRRAARAVELVSRSLALARLARALCSVPHRWIGGTLR